VHTGALGWNGFLTYSMLYWLFPRLWNTRLYSVKLANWHFWLGLMGIMFYAIPMYWAGVTQGLMWKEFTADGFLRYPNFLETVLQLVPMYQLRAIGGTLYLIGACIGTYNLYKTAKSGVFAGDTEVQAAPLSADTHPAGSGHRWLESKAGLFTALSVVAILIGGAVEIIPLYLIRSNVPTISSVKPYTPLEVLGRDLYIREGCVGCHSQMIRPFRSETERYGEYSKAGEFVYDHPFLWGSKRTGPDLHRVGGKYPDAWHYNHMEDPRSTSPGSLMPAYPWLLTQKLDIQSLPARLRALRKVGVPYPDGYEKEQALKDLQAQSAKIVANLQFGMITNAPADSEIIGMIAYLQRLGTDIKSAPSAADTTTPATDGLALQTQD
jgi:cytochrome c oxidase cbb3-type subunit I/II